MDDAVSSSEPACCSVREERSWLPAAICADAVAIASEPERIWLTVLARFSAIRFKAFCSWPISSSRSTTIGELRSPAATVSAT